MEVALCFALFVTLVFGVIDLSRYFFTQQALTTLVNSTARLGYANISAEQGMSPQTLAATYAPLLDPSQVNISLQLGPGQTYPNCNQPVATGVQVLCVTATCNYTPLTPLLGSLVGQMTASATYQY